LCLSCIILIIMQSPPSYVLYLHLLSIMYKKGQQQHNAKRHAAPPNASKGNKPMSSETKKEMGEFIPPGAGLILSCIP
jgi:hypothetical protein